jgi:hypothetical protein
MGAGSGTTAASSRKTGLLPSLPSLSLPKKAANFCWNACTGAFKCLKDRFQAPAKPIEPKRAEVLTKQVATVARRSAHGASRHFPIGRPAMMAAACVAAICALEVCQAAAAEVFGGDHLPPIGDRVATTFANTFAEGVTGAFAAGAAATFAAAGTFATGVALAAPLENKGRRLLSNDDDESCDAVVTEGIPFSKTVPIWTQTGPFSAAQGSFVTSTLSPLPTGVELRFSALQVSPKSYPFQNTLPLFASSGDASYLVGTDGTLQVINSDPSDPYVVTTTNPGFVPTKMMIVGSKLILSGPETSSSNPTVLIQAYDITTPKNPVDAGQVIGNVGETIMSMTSTGNRVGVITNSRLVSIDTTNNQMTSVFLSGGTAIGASNSHYYVGKLGSIQSYSISNLASPPIPLSILTTGTPYSILSQNGYCYVGVADHVNSASYFYTILCPADGSMNIVATRSDLTTVVTTVSSMFPQGNTMYYTTFDAGIGVMYLGNPASPVFPTSTSGLLPEIGAGANFADLGNGVIGVKTGTGFYPITPPNFTLRGTAAGGTAVGGGRTTFPVAVTGRTLNGAVINGTRNCSVIVNPAITMLPIQDLIAVVGQVFSYTIPQGSIVHARGLAMRVTYTCTSGQFTTWVVLDPITQRFSGVPLARTSPSTCTLQVTDAPAANPPSTAVPESFRFSAIERPVMSAIASRQCTVGVPCLIPLEEFAQYDGPLALTLSPLPPSFSFNGNLTGNATIEDGRFSPYTMTLSATPIGVTATQPSSLIGTSTFVLTVVPPGNPVVVATLPSQSAYARNKGSFQIPRGLCANPTNTDAPMDISVSGLADWMSYNSETNTVEWEPGILDRFLPADNAFPIIVTCSQRVGGQQYSASTTLVIVLTGALSLGSILLASLTPAAYLYRRRKDGYNAIAPYGWARLTLSIIFSVGVVTTPLMFEVKRKPCSIKWNPFTFKQRDNREFYENQSVSIDFESPAGKIHYFKITYTDTENDKVTHSDTLPDWLKVKRVNAAVKRIYSTCVPASFFKAFRVYAKTKGGLDLEAVEFKKSEKADFKRTCNVGESAFTEVKYYALASDYEQLRHRKPGAERFNYNGQMFECLLVPPNGLRYDPATKSLIGDSVPNTPLIVRLFGQGNKELDTVYMNIKPSTMIEEITEKEGAAKEDVGNKATSGGGSAGSGNAVPATGDATRQHTSIAGTPSLASGATETPDLLTGTQITNASTVAAAGADAKSSSESRGSARSGSPTNDSPPRGSNIAALAAHDTPRQQPADSGSISISVEMAPAGASAAAETPTDTP